MKNFNLLHLSGFSALGLLTACLAQQWFGEHNTYNRTSEQYSSALQRVQVDQTQLSQESARIAILRADRLKAEHQRDRIQTERQQRDQAWQAFYSKPAQCQYPATNVLFTACTNDYIQAKREFNQRYEANQTTVLQPFQSSLASNEQ